MKKTIQHSCKAACMMVGILSSSTVTAEGSAEIPPNQSLISSTVIFVDILDAENETFTWTGTGSVAVTGPGGSDLGDIASGVAFDPQIIGRYSLTLYQNQEGGWDVTVENGTGISGRVSSANWTLQSGGYDQQESMDSSFYALVPGGNTGLSAVIEIKFDGQAGFSQVLGANQSGIMPNAASISVPKVGFSFIRSIPLYLNVPDTANFSTAVPSIASFSTTTNGPEDYEFSFISNVQGTYYVLVDANEDGIFDLSSDEVIASGTTNAGTNNNNILWDGTDLNGNLMPAGNYDSQVRLHVGELHYIADDVETSYEGLRFFELNSSFMREPMDMHWNDSMVQDDAVTMPSGEQGLESSGAEGVSSGDYVELANPNVNARSWGNFTTSGKGNNNLLNTFTWIEEAQEITSIEILPTREMFCKNDSFDSPLDQDIYLKRSQSRALPIHVVLIDSDSNIVTPDNLSMPPVINIQYSPGQGEDGSNNSDLVPPGLADDGNALSYNWDTMQWKIILSTKQFTSPGQYDMTLVAGDSSYTIDQVSCSGRFYRME